ncbi:hypothetical protein M3226_30120 [Neobacillus cucumis]|uniref:hypothetical protein n=1 Tax=Neobacillus cucumis TaxID=1740721 RepID=UPI00203F1A8F|nr:hypothetical protein [Neobacillus cucumis]MCM3729791.1 hypothetical protein [Neobacillus cucumis]
MNEEQNITYNKRFYRKKNEEHRAWDKICAIMDRLDDTVDYLNGLKLNTGKHSRSAFDFYDFMNNASVVVDCVKELAKIFDVSDDEIKKSTDIFNQVGEDGEGTDERYFEYLRSLCSVHPVETSRHKRYQDNDFECSPFVAWNDGRIWRKDVCDIYAVVYTSKDGSDHKRVGIYISQIFEYVKTRLEFVAEITNAIDQYHKQVISDFKDRPIKKEKEFDNYIDYLRNLDTERSERYGSNYSPFGSILNLFKLKLSNPKNEIKMVLYLNALKYAIEFEYNSLQNMSYEGLENNGLLYPKRNVETSIYIELYDPDSESVERRKYGYNLEKISYLNYDFASEGDKQWAYEQLEDAMPFLEKYVSFEDAEGDFEHYALVQLALYLDCLENKCLINKNIPNDLKYRERLLSDEEWEGLFSDQ